MMLFIAFTRTRTTHPLYFKPYILAFSINVFGHLGCAFDDRKEHRVKLKSTNTKQQQQKANINQSISMARNETHCRFICKLMPLAFTKSTNIFASICVAIKLLGYIVLIVCLQSVGGFSFEILLFSFCGGANAKKNASQQII